MSESKAHDKVDSSVEISQKQASHTQARLLQLTGCIPLDLTVVPDFLI